MKKIISQFLVDGDFISSKPYGNGHINDTYLVEMKNNNEIGYYILQKINHKVFNDVDLLMNNIVNVTSFLSNKIKKSGGSPDRETLTVIKTKDNRSYYYDKSGYYRLYIFIDNAKVFQLVENSNQFYQAGYVVGKFQKLLMDFDVDLIDDVIKDFHNTPKRYKDFCNVVKLDKFGRAEKCKKEIEFIHSRKNIMNIITDGLKKGELPTKVTHNDTKLNNILFDKNTNEALCLIDFDTIMKGSLLYDFGDAIRFGASTALEDETDLSKVNFDFDLYKSFTDGFLTGISNKLTNREFELLPLSAIIMTLECGMRFLTDYINGDVYFKTQYEKHNLERAKNQFKLLSDMEENYDKMIEYLSTFK